MIKLYYAPHTCSLASHIALEEAGAEYSTVRIDFDKEEQRSPEYLAVNPKGRVPAMVTDRGILTETPAMLAFIAQSFPRAQLAPLADPFASRRCRPLIPICARPCTSPMRTACAAGAGRTIRPQSPR
jgi:glutathione S-transferase